MKTQFQVYRPRVNFGFTQQPLRSVASSVTNQASNRGLEGSLNRVMSLLFEGNTIKLMDKLKKIMLTENNFSDIGNVIQGLFADIAGTVGKNPGGIDQVGASDTANRISQNRIQLSKAIADLLVAQNEGSGALKSVPACNVAESLYKISLNSIKEAIEILKGSPSAGKEALINIYLSLAKDIGNSLVGLYKKQDKKCIFAHVMHQQGSFKDDIPALLSSYAKQNPDKDLAALTSFAADVPSFFQVASR